MPRTRQELEQIEKQNLAPYAQFSADTRGRKYKEAPPEWRTQYQRDRDRVIHSRAFRCLEYKTQVFLNGTGDHLRTRLTHTIEVAGISRNIARALKLNEDLTETIALLNRTPPILDAMLRGLPNAWLRGNEGIASDGKESWNAFDVIGHLIVGERTDWMPRVRILLEKGESRPFDPFDRFAQSRENGSQDNPLDQLLDEFASRRKENLIALRALNLQPEDLARRGTHPALGTVTLSELLATWAVHDLTHLHQLSRVMAHQYCDAVGPWKAYLGVLHCAGHSAP